MSFLLIAIRLRSVQFQDNKAHLLPNNNSNNQQQLQQKQNNSNVFCAHPVFSFYSLTTLFHATQPM